jgi:hypothetical protein
MAGARYVSVRATEGNISQLRWIGFCWCPLDGCAQFIHVREKLTVKQMKNRFI